MTKNTLTHDMKQDMKRNIQMRNMEFTERKQHTVVRADLKSGRDEYKDLKSDRCISASVGFAIRLLLLFLTMTVGAMGVWGQFFG